MLPEEESQMEYPAARRSAVATGKTRFLLLRTSWIDAAKCRWTLGEVPDAALGGSVVRPYWRMLSRFLGLVPWYIVQSSSKAVRTSADRR